MAYAPLLQAIASEVAVTSLLGGAVLGEVPNLSRIGRIALIAAGVLTVHLSPAH